MVRAIMDSERRPNLRGKRVLVVNDTQEILELFTDVLGEMGLEAIQMSYAPRELDRIRAVDPDLIILDFVFGERELLGWQLLQKLKMDRRLERVPVIVCSAAVRMLSELEGYLTEHGVVSVLKPFTIGQLEEAIRKSFTDSRTAGRIAHAGSGAVDALGDGAQRPAGDEAAPREEEPALGKDDRPV